MNTKGHYMVEHHRGGYMDGWVKALFCAHCPYYEVPARYRRFGDRSGLARYGRARAKMVKHLHAAHRELLLLVLFLAAGCAASIPLGPQVYPEGTLHVVATAAEVDAAWSRLHPEGDVKLFHCLMGFWDPPTRTGWALAIPEVVAHEREHMLRPPTWEAPIPGPCRR